MTLNLFQKPPSFLLLLLEAHHNLSEGKEIIPHENSPHPLGLFTGHPRKTGENFGGRLAENPARAVKKPRNPAQVWSGQAHLLSGPWGSQL